MKFENIEVGDHLIYNGTYSKVIMKDENRMVIDADRCYLADWGKCEPVELIWCSSVEQMGYRKTGQYDNTTIYKKDIKTTSSCLGPVVHCRLHQNEDKKWFMSIKVTKGLNNELCFDSISNLPIKYCVQIERMEEAFRILASSEL